MRFDRSVMRLMLSIVLLGAVGGFVEVEGAIGQSVPTSQSPNADQKAEAVGEALREANRLVKEGNGLIREKKYPAALESFQKALEIYREIKNSAGIGSAENGIGDTQYWLGSYQLALEGYGRSLIAYQSANNKGSIAQLWMNIGSAHRKLKQYPQSIEAFQKALPMYTALKNDNAIGNAYNKIGDSYYDEKQYVQALEAYQTSLKIYEKTDNQIKLANAWINIAYTYRQQTKYSQAVEAFHQSLKIYQAKKQPRDVANIWISIGWTYNTQEDSVKALEAFQKAVEIAREIPDKLIEFNAIKAQGSSYISQGNRFLNRTDYQESIESFEKALLSLELARTIARNSNNVEGEQNSIRSLLNAYLGKGFAFDNQQKYTEALASFRQGLLVWQQFKDRLPIELFLEQELSTLRLIGNTYSNNGQYRESIKVYEEALEISIQLKNVKEQADLMIAIAAKKNDLGEYTSSLDFAQRAITLARNKLKLNSKVGVSALIQSGKSLGALGQYDMALDNYQQALVIARDLQDVSSERSLLNNIAGIYSTQGQYLKSLAYAQQAFSLNEAAIQRIQTGSSKEIENLCSRSIEEQDKAGRESCIEMFQYGSTAILNHLGLAYSGSGRYTEALQAYEQALNIAQRYKSLSQQTSLLLNIGSLYIDTGNNVKALDVVQQALSIAIRSEARSSQVTAFNNIGLVYAHQGKFIKALDYYQRSLSLAREIKSPSLEATALNNIGSIYDDQGDYTRALESFQSSLVISQKNGLSTGTELNNIASVYQSQGRYVQAIEQFQKTVTIARQTGDRPMEVLALRNIGLVYQDQADYTKAQDFYQQAQVLSKEMGNPSSELTGLLRQGMLLASLGQYQQSLEIFQQSLILSRVLGQRDGELGALANIATVYRKQENYPLAIEHYQNALHIARQTGDVSSEASILTHIAKIYEKQGNLSQAVDLLQQALKIQRQIGEFPDEIWTLNTLGSVYTAQGKFAEAQATLQRSLIILKEVSRREYEAEALKNLGIIFAKQNQPQLAIVLYKQSVIQYEAIRKGLAPLPKDQQESYTKTVATTYRNLAELLIKENRLLEAQQVLDLLKLQEIKDYSQPSRDALQQANLELSDIEKSIAQQYNSLISFRQKLDQCQGKTNNSDCDKLQQAQLQQSRALDQFIDELQAKVRDRCKDLQTCLLPGDKTTASANKLIAAQPGSIVILPVVLDQTMWILVISENGQITRYESKVDRITLGKKVLELREFLNSPNTDLTQLKATSKQLYDWLIQPIEPTIKASKAPPKLIFALDRVTRYIPMGVLYDGQQYLAQRYPISTVLSLETTKTEKSTIGNIQNTNVLALGLSKQTAEFTALPSVEPELASIVQTTGIYPGLPLLNQNFTLSNLLNNLTNKKILHIATHGKFDSIQKNGSFLVLGNGDKLPIRDIRAIKQSHQLELVVLSACQTALGNAEQEGIEIPGISSYFLNNGVGTVMASLWSVDDASTALMMQRFYQYLSQGKTKAEAIQQAQLDLLKLDNPQAKEKAIASLPRFSFPLAQDIQPAVRSSRSPGYIHPYYWAPFILIGNSQ